MKFFVFAAATLVACTCSTLAEESLGDQLTAIISGIAHLYWPPLDSEYPLPTPSYKQSCDSAGDIGACPASASVTADHVGIVDTGVCPLRTSDYQSETGKARIYNQTAPISTTTGQGYAEGTDDRTTTIAPTKTGSLLSATQTGLVETTGNDKNHETIHGAPIITTVQNVWTTHGTHTVHDVVEKIVNNIVYETAHGTVYNTVHETINNAVSVPHTVKIHDTVDETINKVDKVPVTVPVTSTDVQTSVIPVTSMVSTTVTDQGPTVVPMVTFVFPNQVPPPAGGAPGVAPGSPSSSESPTSTTSLIPLQTRINTYDYVGCFKYNATDNILKSGIEKKKELQNGNMYFCSQECRLSRFVALSEGTQCFCGAEMQKGAVKVNNSECNTPCGNKPLETPCGGNKTVFGVYENVRGAPSGQTAYQKSGGVVLQPSKWMVSLLISLGAFLSGSVH